MKLVSCHVKNASRAEYGGAHLQSPNLRGRSRRISVRPADSLAHMAKQGYVVRPCHKTKQNRLSLYRFTLYGYIYNHAFQRSRPTAHGKRRRKDSAASSSLSLGTVHQPWAQHQRGAISSLLKELQPCIGDHPPHPAPPCLRHHPARVTRLSPSASVSG